jgi:hypothetical protein
LPSSGDNSDRAAKTVLLGRIASQGVRVPDAMSTVDDWRRASIRVRGAVMTLFRGDRPRTDGNDDGYSNRGLGKHSGISHLKIITPSWCDDTIGPRKLSICEADYRERTFLKIGASTSAASRSYAGMPPRAPVWQPPLPRSASERLTVMAERDKRGRALTPRRPWIEFCGPAATREPQGENNAGPAAIAGDDPLIA